MNFMMIIVLVKLLSQYEQPNGNSYQTLDNYCLYAQQYHRYRQTYHRQRNGQYDFQNPDGFVHKLFFRFAIGLRIVFFMSRWNFRFD